MYRIIEVFRREEHFNNNNDTNNVSRRNLWKYKTPQKDIYDTVKTVYLQVDSSNNSLKNKIV